MVRGPSGRKRRWLINADRATISPLRASRSGSHIAIRCETGYRAPAS